MAGLFYLAEPLEFLAGFGFENAEDEIGGGKFESFADFNCCGEIFELLSSPDIRSEGAIFGEIHPTDPVLHELMHKKLSAEKGCGFNGETSLKLRCKCRLRLRQRTTAA